ncbi:peptide ABC transporter substrate-binding protein [Lutispora saccharofermentans]|uniref:Peptide ABC transporter substrate-binding protein n=1 Tax=Lutispora saccharofermentans TaxID=3024236 RepID=A0ABT1NDK6_9FIRM|nr:peptide ABC transporter substrate-binding protein [Lutispora saccharofermentans]MCQ1529337.1 peptide ABC transporter substrate-binding protein [Lutispora saccharofermentans]
MKRLAVWMVIISMAALAFTGCSSQTSSEVKYEDVYRTTFSTEYKTLNPYNLSSTSAYTMVANSIDGLVENDKYGMIVPSLAESWKSNDDYTVWTYKLREGIFWVDHTGAKTEYEVTADDFVEGIRYIADPKNGAKNISTISKVISGLYDYYWDLADIDDGEDIGKTREDVLKSFDEKVGVKALDKYTVEYSLDSSTPFFNSYLVIELFYPVEKAFLDKVGEDFGTSMDKMLYNGGYYISTWERDKLVVLTKNEHYWDKDNIFVKELNFQRVGDEITGLEMFQRGELTGCSITADQLKALKGSEWEKYIYLKDKNTVTFWFTMNFISKNQEFRTFINNVNFRKALLYGIDRVKISALYEPDNPEFFVRNTIIPEDTLIDPNGVDYTDYPDLKPIKENIPYDPAKAKEYMQKAAAELCNPDGTIKGLSPAKVDMGNIAEFQSDAKLPVELVLATTTDPLETKKALLIAEMLKQNLGEENIKVIVGYSATSFQDEVFSPMNFDLVDDSYSFRFADPSANLARLTTDGSLNEGGYDIPEYDQLVGKASLENNIAERYKLFSEAEKYMLDNVYLMPYMTGGGSYRMSKELPYQTPMGGFGLTRFKMKGAKIQDKPVTIEQYNELKVQHEKEMAEKFSKGN